MGILGVAFPQPGLILQSPLQYSDEFLPPHL